MPGQLGNKSITLTAFRNQTELAKLPAPGVEWRWSEFVGNETWKCDASPAVRLRNAGEIERQREGVYRVSEALEAYLSSHGVELGAWRTSILDVGAVFSGSQRVAQRREEEFECVGCDATFDCRDASRTHYARSHTHTHACVCEQEEEQDGRGEQTELQQFADVGKSIVTECGGGQAKLVV